MSLLSSRVDIRGIFTKAGVAFVEAGKNVKTGNINIKCPWCGDADPSFHMGVHPEKLAFACWRDKAHRGKNLARLLSRACGMTYGEAAILVGQRAAVNDDDFTKLANGQAFDAAIDTDIAALRPDHLDFPSAFRKVLDAKTAGRFHRTYLRRRLSAAKDLASVFDLRYCVTGAWSGRIIVPYVLRGEVMTWTARAVGKSESLRYLTLPEQDSVRTAKELLYGEDNCSGGALLLLVEGPFDALNFYHCAKSLACDVVAISSASIEDAQFERLRVLSKKYDALGVCLDFGYPAQQMRAVNSLEVLKKPVFLVPLHRNCEDPGSAPDMYLRRGLKKALKKIGV